MDFYPVVIVIAVDLIKIAWLLSANARFWKSNRWSRWTGLVSKRISFSAGFSHKLFPRKISQFKCTATIIEICSSNPNYGDLSLTLANGRQSGRLKASKIFIDSPVQSTLSSKIDLRTRQIEDPESRSALHLTLLQNTGTMNWSSDLTLSVSPLIYAFDPVLFEPYAFLSQKRVSCLFLHLKQDWIFQFFLKCSVLFYEQFILLWFPSQK